MLAKDRARWKQHEREAAAILGGERQPSNGKRQEDIAHPLFTIESKERKNIPDWWRQALDQLKFNPADKIKLLLFTYAPNIKGRRMERYAILHLEDLAALYRILTPDQIQQLLPPSTHVA